MSGIERCPLSAALIQYGYERGGTYANLSANVGPIEGVDTKAGGVYSVISKTISEVQGV